MHAISCTGGSEAGSAQAVNTLALPMQTARFEDLSHSSVHIHGLNSSGAASILQRRRSGAVSMDCFLDRVVQGEVDTFHHLLGAWILDQGLPLSVELF
jgi:hypothetical protein